MFIIGSHTCSE